jgi:hypothetical protein
LGDQKLSKKDNEDRKELLKNAFTSDDKRKKDQLYLKRFNTIFLVLICIILIVGSVFFIKNKVQAHQRQQQVNFQSLINYSYHHKYSDVEDHIEKKFSGSKVKTIIINEHIDNRNDVDPNYQDNSVGYDLTRNQKETVAVFNIKNTGQYQYLMLRYGNQNGVIYMVNPSEKKPTMFPYSEYPKYIQTLKQEEKNHVQASSKLQEMRSSLKKELDSREVAD